MECFHLNKSSSEYGVSFVYNALVLPYSGFNATTKSFEGGVYDQDGSFVERSRQVKAGFNNVVVDPPQPKSFNSGKFIYGGLLVNNHFGHLLIESLSRLWVCNYFKEYTSVVFSLRNSSVSIPSYVFNLFEVIGIKNIKIVDEPEAFEFLVVPEQLAHPERGYILGYEPNKNLFRGIISPRRGYPEKVYISRSELGKDDGGFVSEKILERNLERDGYKIVHPQLLELKEQIAIYVSAKKVIFSDGSAFHLYALFSRSDQDVFVVWRRDKIASFSFQLRSFSNKTPLGDPHVLGYYDVREGQLQKSRRRSQICFERLRKQLQAEGFLNSSDWSTPSRDDVDREVKIIEEALGSELVYRADAQFS